MLDKGGAVKNFVDALQQLTNPDMIFKVIFHTKKSRIKQVFRFWPFI